MNYDITELVARMNSGESADAIAEEMTAALTAANKQYQEEQEAKKMEFIKRTAMQEKFNDMAAILEALREYVKKYCPLTAAEISLPAGILDDEDKNDVFENIIKIVVEALDKTEARLANPNQIDPMEAFMSMMFGMPQIDKSKPCNCDKTKSEDEILSQFLGSICH